MKRTTRGLLPLAAVLFAAAVSFAAEPKAATVLGVSKVVVGVDSIQVTKDESVPSGLELSPGVSWSEAGVKELTVKIGDSFTVSDRQHVGASYKLIGIKDGSASVKQLQWASFSGTKPMQSTHTLVIRTYGVDVRPK